MRTRTPRFAAGPPPLTARQEEVLTLIARGRTNYEIATALGISLEGAKYHVREIMNRLGADSREEAVDTWRRERREQRMDFPVRRWIRSLAPAGWLIGGGAATAVTLFAFTIAMAQRETSDLDAPLERAQPTIQALATPQVAPTQVPAAPIGAVPAIANPYPAGTRTGIGIVDRVLEAMEQADGVAIASLIESYGRPCRDVQAIGAIPCPPGQAQGFLVPVIGENFNGPGFAVDTPEERARLAQQTVARLQAADAQERWDARVLSISEQPPFPAESIPGRYLVVFASGEALAIDDNGITYFFARPDSAAVAGGVSYILPPQAGSNPGTTPTPRAGTLSLGGRTYALAEDSPLPANMALIVAIGAQDSPAGLGMLLRIREDFDFKQREVLLDASMDPGGRKLTSVAASADGQVLHAAWCAGSDCIKPGEKRTGMETEFVHSTDGGKTWTSAGTKEGEWRVSAISGNDAITVRVDVPPAPGIASPSAPSMRPIDIGGGRFIAATAWSSPAGCQDACTKSGSSPAVFDTNTLSVSFIRLSNEAGLAIVPVAAYVVADDSPGEPASPDE